MMTARRQHQEQTIGYVRDFLNDTWRGQPGAGRCRDVRRADQKRHHAAVPSLGPVRIS